MRHRLISAVATVGLVAGLFVVPARAQSEPSEPVTVRAGYGEADATWHVGAGAGQYSRKSPDNIINSVTGGDVDPHGHSIAQQDSYGVQSRLSYRAIVVEDEEGDHVAFVKSDSYLAQDYLTRRVGQILLVEGSAISYDEIFHMASHNHSSPYYMTPSWGVWIFQDAFDIRAFEYHARSMAEAIMRAEENLKPARMGATTVDHRLFKGMVQRKRLADDGTPGGYPDDFGDFGLPVIRFDNIEDPADPVPIATLINWGQHPEGLDDHDLITGDFVASLERFAERATGAPLVFGQGDVGSGESGPGHRDLVAAEGIPARWSHAGHAQAERGGYLLARDVVRGWNEIGNNQPSTDPVLAETFVRFSSVFDVEAGNAWVPGPYSHPYPSVSNCRTETTAKGNTGGPITGLPDCDRGGNIIDEYPPDHPFGGPLGQLWDSLKEAGAPLPEHYDAPSYTGVEENIRLHLQAFKIGEVILMSCACEAQVDLILNVESRANEAQGDFWDGFDWTTRMDCTQAEPPEGDWTCRRKETEPRPYAVLNEHTFTNYEYLRMQAQIHNDAESWDAPENAVAANAEPHEPDEIWGNFTREELPAEFGYKLPIGVGHASDYNGYTVSYREYMGYDEYRKALTSYGPHTADYMNTRLVRLAGRLNGEPQELDPVVIADEARQTADEARQVAMSAALGAASMAAYEAWRAALPTDKGPHAIVTQPNDIEKFNAATVSWRGGSNAIDNPVVTVEQLNADGKWEPYAGMAGEIQTKLEFPNGANAFRDTYSGNQEWIWTAGFEAFDAWPRGIGSTPPGTYRFVIDGHIRLEQEDRLEDRPYHLESNQFEIEPWDGITVSSASSDGSAFSFTVDPVQYPTSYNSVFPYVRTGGKTDQGDDVIKNDELGRPFCTTCTFRPWASSGTLDSAFVTIVHSDGGHSRVEADCDPSTGRCSTALEEGDTAYIVRGDVRDTNGEINGSCYDSEGSNECPAEENDQDADDDGVFNDLDNCSDIANPDQVDSDDDGAGDECDQDDTDGPSGDPDGDGVLNRDDNCPNASNPGQEDLDGDGTGDACDDILDDGPTADPDGDGRSNAEEAAGGSDPRDPCDPDDEVAACDTDEDGIPDGRDNCPVDRNENQSDLDEDGEGDACDESPSASPAPTDSQTPDDDVTPSNTPPQGGGSGGGGGGSNPSSTPTQTAAGGGRGLAGTSISTDVVKSGYRKPFTLSGQVSGDRTCLISKVAISRRAHGTDEFSDVASADVAPDGSWSVSLRSPSSASYLAQPEETQACDGEMSTAVDVFVRAKIKIGNAGACTPGKALRGVVRPNHGGTNVLLQKRRAGHWRTIDRDRLNGRSRFGGLTIDGCRASYRVVWRSQDVRNLRGVARI